MNPRSTDCKADALTTTTYAECVQHMPKTAQVCYIIIWAFSLVELGHASFEYEICLASLLLPLKEQLYNEQ